MCHALRLNWRVHKSKALFTLYSPPWTNEFQSVYSNNKSCIAHNEDCRLMLRVVSHTTKIANEREELCRTQRRGCRRTGRVLFHTTKILNREELCRTLRRRLSNDWNSCIIHNEEGYRINMKSKLQCYFLLILT